MVYEYANINLVARAQTGSSNANKPHSPYGKKMTVPLRR